MAEFVLKDIVKKRGLEDKFYIESAATSTEEIWHGVGNPIYPQAKAKLREHGIGTADNELGVGDKRAKQTTKSDYEKFDYIIGMDRANIRNMQMIYGEDTDNKIYKMLDFDRRLILNIGEQGKENCSIFCLAYAKAILDGSFNVNPYDYWDDGAVWSAAGFHDIAGKDPLDEVLKKAYDQIDSGRPAIIYTSGTYATTVTDKPQDRSASEHFVLLIGFKKNADRNDLKPSDFYGIDPANSYKSTERNYIPWVTLTDTAPAKMLEEYALFVADDQSAHVKTCIAHADDVRWDTSLSFPINPDYVQES